MSYNNYVDADAAWRAAHDFAEPTVAIIKHANPCGIAVGRRCRRGPSQGERVRPDLGLRRRHRDQPPSGCRPSPHQVAEIFTEVSSRRRSTPMRWPCSSSGRTFACWWRSPLDAAAIELRAISGGILLQSARRDRRAGDDPSTWTLATGAAVDDRDAGRPRLRLAGRTLSAAPTRSCSPSDRATVGVGMGQVNRVDAARLAVARAGEERARGAVAASDAFFPFPDGLEVLLEAGVRAVVQPGGSMRDDEVRAAAEAAGVTMYLTGTRHFAH